MPAKYGAIVYSNNFEELSKFYMNFFGMVVRRETNEFVSLDKEGFNIIIHTLPKEMAETKTGSVELFLTVDSLEEEKSRVTKLGGQAPEGEWSNPKFKVCNIVDPEGNIIQLREFT